MPRHLSKIPSTRYLLRHAPACNHLASRLLWPRTLGSFG